MLDARTRRRPPHGQVKTSAAKTWSFAADAPVALHPLAFVTARRWIQLGDGWETTDAGGSWHRLSTDCSQAAPGAPDVVFGDPKTGYATVRGGIRRTLDGGVTWTEVETPGTVPGTAGKERPEGGV